MAETHIDPQTNEQLENIEFSYINNDLFDSVCLTSTYAAKNMDDQQAVDKYAISEDEQEFVNNAITLAINDLFALFVTQTKTIASSLYCTADKCGFSIRNSKVCNPNRLTVLDNYNAEFLVNYILLEWAKSNALENGIVIYNQALEHSRQQIRTTNHEINKPQYVRTYNIITKQNQQ